jgi:signal peptidase II
MPDSVSNANPRKKKTSAAGSVKRLIGPAIIVLVIVIVDQWSKIWAVGALTDQGSHQVFGDFLRFTLVYNLGGAMGSSLGSSGLYLGISCVILPLLGYYLWQYRNSALYSWPLASIMAGAIGNALDRIRIGKVVDFIDVDFFKINLGSFHMDRWWTFNIADAGISCGLVFLVIVLLIHRPKQVELPVEHTEPTA